MDSVVQSHKERRGQNLLAVGVLIAAAVGFFSIGFFPAQALATETPIPVQSDCLSQDWYVNPDELNLLPEQKPQGLLFDGPSLVHHAASGSLKDAPTDGGFTADLLEGVLPLFKMETLSPYSTVNKTGAGKYWSSKISTGPGSQGEPVDSPADLVGKWNYTEATTLLSFGVGYANDTGNKALVKDVSFKASKYDLSCQPEETQSPTPSPSVTTPAPISSPTLQTPRPTFSPINPGGDILPVTGDGGGNWMPFLVGGGIVITVAGGLLLFAFRTRKYRTELP